MNLTTNRVKALQNKSKNELGLFAKTVKRLEKLNSKAQAAQAKRYAKMDKLKSELETLQGIESRNERLVSKIQNFLD